MIINVGKIRVGGNLLTAVAVFTMTVAAPVAMDLPANGGPVSLQAAAAQGNSGGGNGGGNAGGNGGGNAGGNGGGNAGGNGGGNAGAGGGDAGGNAGGAGSASTDSDGPAVILLLMPRVEIATITTSILIQRYPVFKRYPADEIVTFRNPDKAIFFFTEVLNMPGTTITHRWLYKGVIQYVTSFDVMADKSQVWSTRLLPRDKPGQWTIQLVHQDGRVLETRSVDFRPAAT